MFAVLVAVCYAITAAPANTVGESADLKSMWAAAHAFTSRTGDLKSVDTNVIEVESLRERVDAVKNTTECEIRLLAYEYALTQLPERAAQTKMIEVFDALQLDSSCGVPRPVPNGAIPPPSNPLPTGPGVYFVSPDGSDTNSGAENSPFATLQRALTATRAAASGTKAIVLRKGTYYLGSSSIKLTAADSGLLISNYPGEEAWISGGVPLQVNWKSYNVSNGANVWVTDIAPGLLSVGNGTFDGLMTLETHQRLIRARYPNANPEDRSTVKAVGESQGLTGYIAPKKKPAARQIWVNVSKATQKDGKTIPAYAYSILQPYRGFANGVCAKAGDPECPCGSWKDFDADGVWSSYSYHCGGQGPGLIGGGWENMDQGDGYYNGPILPLGLTYDTDTTKSSNLFGQRAQQWKSPEGGLIVAWRAQGWFVNGYSISSVDKSSGTIHWTDSDNMPLGGWQGGRGWQLNGTDGSISPNPPFYVENIFEELDSPSEWFFDPTTNKLYIWYNDTSGTPPPTSTTFVATQHKELIGIRGSQGTPVKDITIRGIGFRDAARTFMEPWAPPSGGDWALYRGAAVFVEGAEDIVIEQNVFKRVDGNAVLLSGYTRDVVIDSNEFTYLGDSAMAAWGRTTEDGDGTGGEQPRRTTVSNNYAHELGIVQLQSSMWFQAKTAQTNITNNVFFNGPRAGINFNDGFGGANIVHKNLIFNQCRQSGDHGPINSWDRQPYLTDVPNGPDSPTYFTALTNVSQNFIIANYGGSQGFDNDDGSTRYNIYNNFIYGEGLKQDYGGHDSIYTGNVNIVHKYDGQNCFNTWPFVPGHEHSFANNTCVVLYTWQVGSAGALNGGNPKLSICANVQDPQQCALDLANNRYFTPFGNYSVGRGSTTLSMLQSGGVEVGSTVDTLPSNDDIIAWGRTVLGM